MELFTGIATLLLGSVFAVAAAAKLLDREGTRQGLIEFGVPIRMAGPGTRLLPLLEATVALAILVPSTSRTGATAAVVLLVAFSGLVAYQLARGRKPACRCFGQMSDAAVGPRTLGRNVALLTLALAVAVQDDGQAVAGLGALLSVAAAGGWTVALVLLNAVALTMLTWVSIGLWQQQGRLLTRIAALEAAGQRAPDAIAASAASPTPRTGLAPGSFAPDFRVRTLTGDDTSLADLLEPDRSTLLLFFDANCGPCDRMLRPVAEWQRTHAGALRIVPVFSGAEDAVRARAKIHRLADVLIQRDFDVGTAFGIPGTPGGVLLTPDGRVQSPVLAGVESITRLLEAVVASHTEPAAAVA